MTTKRFHWSDELTLRALYLYEVLGLSCRQIADVIGAEAGRTLSRMTVIGVINRVNADYVKVPNLAIKPENQDMVRT